VRYAEGLLSATQTLALANECMAMHAAQQLTPARVGADRDQRRCAATARTGLNPDALSAPQQAFADRINELRIALSRH
jgi:SM-20-related protein